MYLLLHPESEWKIVGEWANGDIEVSLFPHII